MSGITKRNHIYLSVLEVERLDLTLLALLATDRTLHPVALEAFLADWV